MAERLRSGHVWRIGQIDATIPDNLPVAHIGDQACKFARLHSQIAHGLRSFGHSLGCLARHFVNFNDRLIDFFAGGRLLLAGRGNGIGLIGCNICRHHNFAQGLPGETGAFCSGIDLLNGIVH